MGVLKTDGAESGQDALSALTFSVTWATILSRQVLQGQAHGLGQDFRLGRYASRYPLPGLHLSAVDDLPGLDRGQLVDDSDGGDPVVALADLLKGGQGQDQAVVGLQVQPAGGDSAEDVGRPQGPDQLAGG